MDLDARAVGLVSCRDYLPQRLDENFSRLWSACGQEINLSSARVLLKPNLITARRGTLACTDAAFILGAARWFRNRGCSVTVGDSPAFGTARSILDRLGIAGSLQKMGVAVSNFKAVRPVTLPSGVKAGMAAAALDCDLLVNLPRVKAHAQLRLTLAVKNYFGCLAGMRKSLWHMRYGGESGRFEALLIEFLAVLPASVTFVDGITAMHRTGPVGGVPFPLRIMACSANPVAVDRSLLEILGVDPHASPLMTRCINEGLHGSSLESLHFPLQTPRELAVENFEVPPQLSPIRFSPCRFVHSSLRRVMQQRPGRGR